MRYLTITIQIRNFYNAHSSIIHAGKAFCTFQYTNPYQHRSFDEQTSIEAIIFNFVYSTYFGLAVQGTLFLTLIAVVLHILDRQGDLVARTDFIWKAKLQDEQEEVETMRGINKVNVNIEGGGRWYTVLTIICYDTYGNNAIIIMCPFPSS